MAYIDSLLASGERPIKREHQHWFILVANAAYGVIALVIALALLFISGNLEILTASESGISRLKKLRDADDFKRAMLEAKHELELELSGSRPLPSPPLRAAAPDQPSAALKPDGPPPAAAPAPAAAAMAASAPAAASPGSSGSSQMSADDVTRTLASLADLRDRGAISAEEYEAKKADLLRRL
jgi:hypothetical protein